jgi:hypothetical protein
MISSAYMLPAELLVLGTAAHLLPTYVYLYLLLSAVELPQLRGLELTRLGVRMLPLSLTRLAGLTRLTFSGEMLRNVQLRDELRQLSNLQVLDISANLAEQLPMGVLELSGLRELRAGERCRLLCGSTQLGDSRCCSSWTGAVLSDAGSCMHMPTGREALPLCGPQDERLFHSAV